MSRSGNRRRRGQARNPSADLDLSLTPLIGSPSGGSGSGLTGTEPRGRHPEGRVMALDVGGRRIGVAVSDETRLIATPLQFVERGPNDLAAIQGLIDQWNAGQIVVGLPTGMSGREGPQAVEVREFTERLKRHVTVPVEFWDERLTTAIAEKSLIESGHRRDARKTKVDAVAAAVILQGYLDRQRFKDRR